MTKDETTFRDRLVTMGLDIDAETHLRYLKLQTECNAKARDADIAPNNN